MSDEQSRQKSGVEAPDHFFMMEARAKGYQTYLSRLKKGGKSGISELFGSAEDVFSGPAEIEPVSGIDFSGLEAPNPEQRNKRAIFFAELVRQHCADFLREHVWACQDGKFGSQTQKTAQRFESDEEFSAVVKDLTCVSLYITAIEQRILDSKVDWLQSLFSFSMAMLDRIVTGPSVPEIMSRYDYFEVPKLCQKAASSVGERLGFGLVGTPAWSGVHDFLAKSGPARREALQQALTSPIERVLEEIG